MAEAEAILGHLGALWRDAVAIWIAGGWAMWPIAAVALVLFGMGVHVYRRLRGKQFSSVTEATWRRWIEHPQERTGPIGELLDFITGGTSVEETARSCQQLQAAEAAPFERDLRVMKVCVSAAPLFGLLGTVTGMLTTFAALASGSGGEKTMTLVAQGISEALITTETGLVVALPGLLFLYQLVRRYDRYKAFLAHLETACTQTLYQRSGRQRQQRTAAQRRAIARLRDAVRSGALGRARRRGSEPAAVPVAIEAALAGSK